MPTPSSDVVQSTRPERSCRQCGGPISPQKKASVQFCGRDCWKASVAAAAGGHVDLVCAECGTSFHRTANRVAAGGGVYCSDACRVKAKARPVAACLICSTPVVAKVTSAGKRQQYCSKTCAGLARRTRVQRTCVRCSAEFEAPLYKVLEGKALYCSKACAFPGPIARTCEACGTAFDAAPSDVAKGWARFCSNECRRTRVDRTCITCGVGFTSELAKVQRGEAMYCSVACRGLARRHRLVRECPVCGAAFELAAGNPQQCCTRACATELRRTDPAAIARVQQMQHDQLTSKAPTRCELALYRYMDEVFGPDQWQRQARILDKWTVDAFVPHLNLVVQADGDFWHGFTEHSRAYQVVTANMGRDQGQNNYLAKVGWPILRLWEHELLEDEDGCVQRLREVAGVSSS